MTSGKVFLVLVGTLVAGSYFFSSSKDSQAEGLRYFSDFSEALAEARSTKKPILLNFGGPW